ncbi:MAG: hypothetical protein ABEJ25_00475, partial [Candidatus Bipolaricaulia bacterium]
ITLTYDDANNELTIDSGTSDSPVSAPSLSGPTEVSPDGTEIDITASGSSTTDPDASTISYNFQLEAGTLNQNGNVATVSFGLNQANSRQTLTAIAIDDQGNRSDASTVDISVMPAGMEPGDGSPSSDPSMGKPQFQLVIPSYNNGNFRYGVAESVNIMFLEEPASDALVKYFWQVSFDGGSTWLTTPFSDNQTRNPSITIATSDTNSNDNNIYVRCEVEVNGVTAMKTSNELTAFSSTQSQTLTSSATPISQNLAGFTATWTTNANELDVQESGNTPFSANDTVFVDGEIDTVASAGSTGSPQTITLNNLDGNDGDTVTIELATSRYDYPDGKSLSGTAVEGRAFYMLSRTNKLSVNSVASDQFEIKHKTTRPFLTNDPIIAIGDSEVKTSVSSIFRELKDQPYPIIEEVLELSFPVSRNFDSAFDSNSGKGVISYEQGSSQSTTKTYARVFQIQADGSLSFGAEQLISSFYGPISCAHAGNGYFIWLLSDVDSRLSNPLAFFVFEISGLGLLEVDSVRLDEGSDDSDSISLDGAISSDENGLVYAVYNEVVSSAIKAKKGTVDQSTGAFSIDSEGVILDASNNAAAFQAVQGAEINGNFLLGFARNPDATDPNSNYKLGLYLIDSSVSVLDSYGSGFNDFLGSPESFPSRNEVIFPVEDGDNSSFDLMSVDTSSSSITVNTRITVSGTLPDYRTMLVRQYANSGEFFVASRNEMAIGESSGGSLTVSASKTTSDNRLGLFTAYYDSGKQKIVGVANNAPTPVVIIDNADKWRTVITTADSLPNNIVEVESVNYQIKADLDGSGGLQNVTTNTHIVDDSTLRVEGTFNSESGGTATFRLRKDHTDRQDETIMSATSEYDF